MEENVFCGIDHPAVAANDVDALADWYCDVFGYQKYYRHDKPVWLLQAADKTLLEIMPKDDTIRPVRTTWTPGWSHVAIRVTDIDAAIRLLDEQAVHWGGNMMPAIGGGRVRNLFDPEGNMLQILER